MAQVTGNQLFKPWLKTRENLGQPRNVKQVRAACDALIAEVVTKNAERGIKNPFVVCAINRNNSTIHRWFNLAMTVSDEVRPSNFQGVLEYAGALGHAEALLEGDWYIAGPEEEEKRRAFDEKETRDAHERINEEKMGKMKEVFQGMAQAVLSVNKQDAPPVSATREKTKA